MTHRDYKEFITPTDMLYVYKSLCDWKCSRLSKVQLKVQLTNINKYQNSPVSVWQQESQ